MDTPQLPPQQDRQVQVGAGLQESRLNTDLIQWLEKYGTWILMVVLVVVLGYFGLTRYRIYRADQLDRAFEEWSGARGTPGPDGVLGGSPDSLLRVAREHRGQAAIAQLASIDAAEIFLGAARRGLRPGANLQTPTADDLLSEAQVSEFLTKADGLFAGVVSDVGSSADRAPLALRALWGRASTAISLGEMDRARTLLTDLASRATSAGFSDVAAKATARIELLPSLATPVALLRDADLPAVPTTAPPAAIPDEEALQIERMPDGWSPSQGDAVIPSPSAPQAPAPGAQPKR